MTKQTVSLDPSSIIRHTRVDRLGPIEFMAEGKGYVMARRIQKQPREGEQK